ncbi:unnamed protein product, partial [Symbiodinium microadriaticum]
MSGEFEKETAASRSKDGVPSWNGEANSFAAYEESALLWEQGLVYNKRYTAAPRLMAELTGAARHLVAGKSAEGLASPGGVRILLDYLRKSLGKPRVNEVTDLLGKYFKGTRRRTGESMNDYITRKSEAFLRVSQALRRVQPHYQRPKPSATSWESRGRRDSDLGSQWGPGTWSRQDTGGEEPPDGDDDVAADGVENENRGRRASDGSSSWSSSWQTWQAGWNNWGWNAYDWNSSYYQNPASSSWSWYSPSTTSFSSWTSIEALEDESLLPSFIQGWYLLTDAALDANERNLVTTALAGDFTPARVAQELRNQFAEAELKRRDHSRRGGQAYVGIHDEEDGTPPGDEFEWDSGDLPAEEADDDEVALLANIESETHQAWAAFQHARRTLKDARMRQHSNKLSRQYYKSNSSFKPSGSGDKTTNKDENIECLRCGRKGHRVANCPEKPLAARAETTATTSTSSYHQAPFVCFAEAEHLPNYDEAMVSQFMEVPESFVAFAEKGGDAESALATLPSTAEAIAAGFAVVDGGATKTIGSVSAIEALLACNVEKHGESRLRDLDRKNQPTFGFGNSTENQCLSTCKVGVTADGAQGSVQIHSLECGSGPILLSVDALRALGAVVDFRNDLMVLTELSNQKIIPLRRSAAGHQLLSLTDDLFKDALDASMPVLQLCIPLVPKPLCNMDRLSRPELILHLRALGEEAPEAWTKIEVQQRIAEIAEANPSLAATTSAKTDMQTWMSKLNKASRKKSELRTFCETELGLMVGDCDTIAVMQKKATSKILEVSEPQGCEPLGFGKHSQRTYSETFHYDRDYCEWVKATHREGSCCPRLARFARWLNNLDEAKTTPPLVHVPRPKARGAKSQAKTPTGSAEINPTSSSSSSQNAEPDARDHLLLQMAATIKDLQEEMSQIRAERPRK